MLVATEQRQRKSTGLCQNIPKIWTLIFTEKSKISKGYSMAEKTGRNGDGERCSNFGLKLNVHVQYNMLTAIWPATIT